MHRRRFDLLAIVALLLAFAAVGAAPFGPKALGDRTFHDEAKQLAGAITGRQPWSAVEISKAPGPVLFYAVPYVLVPADAGDDAHWRAGVAWAAGWMVVSLLLIRRAAERLSDERGGRWAAALMVLSPFGVYYSFGILAEGPAFVGTIVFLFGWARSIEARRASGTFVALMVTGLVLLILSRPNAALLLGVPAVVWVLVRRRDRSTARLAAASIVVSTLMFVVLGVGLARLGPREASARWGYFFQTALQGRFQYRHDTFDWRYWDLPMRSGSRDYREFSDVRRAIKEHAASQGRPAGGLFREWVIRDTLAHPFLTLKMAAVRLVTMHLNVVNSKPPSAFAAGPLPGPLVYWSFHIAVNAISLAVVGLALSFLWNSRPRFLSYWPLWGPWLALALFHAVVYAEPRYLLPATACQMVMAACEISRMGVRGAPSERGKLLAT